MGVLGKRTRAKGGTRRIVCWRVSSSLRSDLALDALEMALWARGKNADGNALAETIIGLYKTEVIRRRGPRRGIDDVEFATLEWNDWFNNRRLLEPIGDIPPAEYEMLFWRETGRTDTAWLCGRPRRGRRSRSRVCLANDVAGASHIKGEYLILGVR